MTVYSKADIERAFGKLPSVFPVPDFWEKDAPFWLARTVDAYCDARARAEFKNGQSAAAVEFIKGHLAP